MTTRLVLLGMLIAVPLQAQKVTLGANFGGSSAASDLTSSTDWKGGWSAAATLGYRMSPRFGLRGDATWAQNDLHVGTASAQEIKKNSFIANGIWQREETPGTKVLPYVLAGLGAVRVRDKASDSSFTKFATNLGAGLGYVLGRVALRAEMKDMIYKFNEFGYDKTQNDLLWQAGFTVKM